MDGFLGTRASIMLDIVFLAMFAVVPTLAWSIHLVRNQRNYALHKRVQVTLGLILLVAVTLFEIDMRFVTDWRLRAKASPYFGDGAGMNSIVMNALYVHLVFAVTTAVLWIVVMARALRNIPSPPGPCRHSAWHKRWGWIAALDMLGTSVTGWVFYWLAFVAT